MIIDKDKTRKVLTVLAIVLFAVFAITLIIDFVNYNEYYSAPFYVNIIIRALEFLVPGLVCLLIRYLVIK